MLLTATVSENIGLSSATLIALLGYAVVFFGLILLMAVVTALGKSFQRKKAIQADPSPAAVPAATAPAAPVAAAPVCDVQDAPGSAGKLKLHDVEPRTAAMLMAIVAYKMGKPLNELRFKSIKEVK